MSKKEDPRIRRTKLAFENALLDLMKYNDYEKISVSKLAEKAELNRATFYLHYADKEDLLEQYLKSSLEEFKENARILNQEFCYVNHEPHPMLVRVFEYIQKNYRFYKIMLAHEKNPQILYSVTEIIQSFVEASNARLHHDGIRYIVPEELSKVYFTSAYIGVIIWWLKNSMPYSPAYMAAQITTISTIGPFEKNPFNK